MDHTEAIVEIKNIIQPEFNERIISLINKKCIKKLGINTGKKI